MDRDRGERLRLALDSYAFLGLNCAVQAIAPATARHESPGKLIHNHHLAILHNILDVLLKQAVGAEQLCDVVDFFAALLVLLLDTLPALFLFRVGHDQRVHFLQCQH